MSTSKHLRISGRVQGVGFRMYMQQRADDLGVTGWVRNRRDGTVESVVQGTPEAVKAIIAWAHKGPPSAVVTDVKTTDAGPEMFPRFSARPTE
jgi:acylphosphatase